MARKQIHKILHNGTEYFSLGYASQLSGYHRERIRQFIREGKLPAEKIGTVWYVAENAFSEFCKKVLNINKNINEIERKTSEEINSKILQKFGEFNNNLHKLDVRLSKFESSVSPDPWDRALLEGERNNPLPQKPSGFPNLPTFKSAVVKSLSVVLIIFASVFFTKNFDRATADVLLAGRQAQLAAASLQETAVGTAADIRETALNLPDQARSFAEQTLNQFYSLSLSLSLSRQTSPPPRRTG